MLLLLHFIVVDEFIILVGKRKQNISAQWIIFQTCYFKDNKEAHDTRSKEWSALCRSNPWKRNWTRRSSHKFSVTFNFLTSSLKLGLYGVYATVKLNTKRRMTLNPVLLLASLSSCMLIPGLYSSEVLTQDLVHSKQALHQPSYNPAPYCLLCYKDQVFLSRLCLGSDGTLDIQ